MAGCSYNCRWFFFGFRIFRLSSFGLSNVVDVGWAPGLTPARECIRLIMRMGLFKWNPFWSKEAGKKKKTKRRREFFLRVVVVFFSQKQSKFKTIGFEWSRKEAWPQCACLFFPPEPRRWRRRSTRMVKNIIDNIYLFIYYIDMIREVNKKNHNEKFFIAIAHGSMFSFCRLLLGKAETNKLFCCSDERIKRRRKKITGRRKVGGRVCQKSVAAGIPIRFHPLRKVPSVEGKPEKEVGV